MRIADMMALAMGLGGSIVAVPVMPPVVWACRAAALIKRETEIC